MLQGSAGAVGTKKHVNAGDVIGQCGSTGLSSGPHLHLCYIPSDLFTFSGYVDPAPCLSKLAAGSITIGDNGWDADDSFEVAIWRGRVAARLALFLDEPIQQADSLFLLHRLLLTTRSFAIPPSVLPTHVQWVP